MSTENAADRVIRFPELKRLVGLSRTSIWRLERRKLFPARLKLGANSVAWREADVRAWLADRPVL